MSLRAQSAIPVQKSLKIETIKIKEGIKSKTGEDFTIKLSGNENEFKFKECSTGCLTCHQKGEEGNIRKLED